MAMFIDQEEGVVRIWVGSWNMGAKEFRPYQKADVEKVIPRGYDIYVFGVQVSEK